MSAVKLLSDSNEFKSLKSTITSGRLGYRTYGELSVVAAANGILAEVPTTDFGIHTDLVTGLANTRNSGIFRKTTAGWERLYDASAVGSSSPSSSTTWWVSPTGTSNSPGTQSQPWSYAWLTDPANLSIQPGDKIWFDWDGPNFVGSRRNRLNRSGTPERKVVYQKAPGRSPIVDFRLVNVTWVEIDPVLHIWETVQAFSPGVTNLVYGANIKLVYQIPEVGEWYPVIPARGGAVPVGAQMRAADDKYRPDGLFFPGPIIERIDSTGKFQIRLSPRSAATMLNREVCWPTDLNPNNNDIAISLNAQGVELEASNVEFDGIVFQNAYATMGATSEAVTAGVQLSNITFKNGADYPIYSSFSSGFINNLTVCDWKSDGGLRSRWWGSYIGVKGGVTALERVRKNAISSGGNKVNNGVNNIYASTGARFYRWTVTNFFDCCAGTSSNMQFGMRDPTDIYDDDKAWANRCNFINIWDDSFQIYADARNLIIEDCFFDGAGVSRDGTNSTYTIGIPGIPRIRRNIFITTKKIFYGEDGAIDGSGGPSLAGERYPAPLSSHGVNSDPNGYTQPWDYQNNFVMFSFPSVATGDLQLTLKNNNNHEGEKNILANNVFIITGTQPVSGSNLLWMCRNLYVGAGREILDSNIWINPEGTLWNVPAITNYASAIIRFVTVNGVDIVDPHAGKGWYDFSELISHSTIGPALKIGYAPGCFASEMKLTTTVRPLETIVNTISWRPLLAEIKSPALDFTTLYQNLGKYRGYHGAKAPL